MEVQPVTGVIGAEIVGADLENLTDAQFEQIEQAFTDHLVLFFRDQPPLSIEAHVAFGKRFGPLHTHPVAPGPEGHPEVMIIAADANSKYADGNNWHTDVSCDELPPLGSCLQLRTLPPVGGDTLFANMYAAYETLSPMMQEFLADKTARHESEHVYRGRYADRGVDDTGKVYPSAEHPVVRTHPRSGRQALYVNPSFGGEPGDPATALRAPAAPGIPGALPLVGERHRLLGQSLHPAFRHLGLLAARTHGPSRHGARRAAIPHRHAGRRVEAARVAPPRLRGVSAMNCNRRHRNR